MKHPDTPMQDELNNIRLARDGINRPTARDLLIWLPALVATFVFPLIGPAVGFILMYFYWLRIKEVARMPCPRCGEPFGSNSRIPFAAGGPTCQSCDLHLNLGENWQDDSWNAS
jgi:hypothetical protein